MIDGFDETNATLDEIQSRQQRRKMIRSTAESRQKLEELLLQYPVFEYGFGDTSEIPFSEKVLEICRTDCLRYENCWACPPNAGSITTNILKANSYRSFVLFSTLNEVADAMNFELCMEAKRPHEELTREFRKMLQKKWDSPFYVLSAGCMYCEKCACPEEPCRHPNERLMTTESHGIVLMQLVEQMGMSVFAGGDVIPYYSMILFE